MTAETYASVWDALPHSPVQAANLRARAELMAHSVEDARGRAYNRTTYLKQRLDMMQRWATTQTNWSPQRM
ncbi:hypothetical protein EDC36_12416 [Tepidimonas ignava]|uniref:Uncharacterized protein n=1 Tax=Tepidimonas ignava TaxID=114249 RepID=A0A4R3L4Q6_9BURK|nr:hypothetical protein [Tepidimonas ignava]MCX7692688.1 hypothetical protein [Tepidimonas taiwanensis]TCS93730.1 hypothetical protein EDC36_12416 [Tepidimonas ignava]TSE18399.1 hypothetical protein Tigna_02562 [Tepidimonas ignava]